eukprot:TRINITY_DN685_c2_g2_i2.p1 TRINITY_DN685_c2_g2~~TRINITY_DN685_c2_g2_i2.p1  ORF type:complete len:201 (+),score=46.73 TRINITY_DN685_c2_g2_i2:526-1128(+)
MATLRQRVRDEPLDTAEQEAICQGYEDMHRKSNKLFSRLFGAVAVIVGLVYLNFAAAGERFHFGAAGDVISITGSLCTAAAAFLCGLRIFGPDTQSLDATYSLQTTSRHRFTFPALALASLPTTYHFYLTCSELYGSISYKLYRESFSASLLLGSLSAHHLLFIWPVFFVLLTEYLCNLMQKGFHDVETLRGAKYNYKSA